MVDPGTLMGEIHAAAVAIDNASRAQGQAIRHLAEAERAYERSFQSALLAIRDEALADGQRLPAEDLRRAMAHKRVPEDIYAVFLRARA